MAELERIYKDTDSGGWGWVTQEATGGGSVPDPGRSQYVMHNVVIPTDTWFNPEWVWANIGDENLLDLTDPANPEAPAEGVYAVSCEAIVTGAEAQAAKAAYLELDLDLNGDDPNQATTFSLDPALDSGNDINASVALSYYVPVSGVISVAFQHNAGVDLEHVTFNIVVQKLT